MRYRNPGINVPGFFYGTYVEYTGESNLGATERLSLLQRHPPGKPIKGYVSNDVQRSCGQASLFMSIFMYRFVADWKINHLFSMI
jgi:hypothetical protein